MGACSTVSHHVVSFVTVQLLMLFCSCAGVAEREAACCMAGATARETAVPNLLVQVALAVTIAVIVAIKFYQIDVFDDANVVSVQCLLGPDYESQSLCTYV